MPLISPPGTNAVDRIEHGVLRGINDGWRNFFNAVFSICNALTTSGPTANRPVSGLWVGRTYFDTTLGFAIWYVGPGWVDATGAPA